MCSNVIGRIPTEALHQIEEKYNIVPHLPVIVGLIFSLDGLPIGQGFVECPECKCIYGKDGLCAHHSKVHSGMLRSHASSLRYVHAQQLNKGSNKFYFEVFPTSPSKPLVSHNNIITFLRKAIKTTTLWNSTAQCVLNCSPCFSGSIPQVHMSFLYSQISKNL